jgi:PKD repeat protein/DNA-binding MarR family transcriptional regulator
MSIDWSFGDGSYWNGTGPAYVQPIHRFDHAGTFTTTVVVRQGNQLGQCSVTLAVSSGPLQTVATVVPTAGVAPLTVQFTASVSGGSGTFSSAVWDFGDGHLGSGFNLSYTYSAAGKYRAQFNVTDSGGASSSTPLWVNVTAPALQKAGGAALTAEQWLLAALGGSGLVVVGLLLYTRSYYSHRAERPTGRPAPPATPVSGAVTAVAAPPVLSTTRSGGTLGPAPPPGPVPTGVARVPYTGPRPTPTIEPALPPLARPTPPERVVPGERLRLSQKVVVHLYSLGTLRDDEVAPATFTQAGMSERLDVGQSPLSNVLRRLVMAGVITQDVRHVRGKPRRLRVYRLTPMGEALATELRRQRSAADGPGSGRPAN